MKISVLSATERIKMTTTKLTESEMAPLRVASLPTRPTAPTSYGGRGYTSVEMKAAFDKLPTLIAERLNSLIDDVESGRICESIPTGVPSLPTLTALLSGIGDGSLAAAIKVFDTSLAAYLAALRSDVDEIAAALGVTLNTEAAE